MDIQGISTLISQLGFPIFVSAFMLLKQSKDTENMITILTELKSAIAGLKNAGRS